MVTFNFKPVSEQQQADFKADGRMRAYLSLKRAFKKRAIENGVTVKSLSQAIGRDKGQISRILAGRSAGVTLDTLVLITSALGFRMSFDAEPVEMMNKRNRNVAPVQQPPTISLSQRENFQGSVLYVGGSANTSTNSSFVSISGSKK